MVQDGALYKCPLLLFEDPALETPRLHEVAVGVGRNEPLAHDTVGPNTGFSGVHRLEDPVGTMLSYLPNAKVLYGVVSHCCVVLCNHFAMGDCDMFLLLMLFACVKTTDTPHVMLCVRPFELGYTDTNHAPRCVGIWTHNVLLHLT